MNDSSPIASLPTHSHLPAPGPRVRHRPAWISASVVGLCLLTTSVVADQPPAEAATAPAEPVAETPITVMAPQRLAGAAEAIISGFSGSQAAPAGIRSERAEADTGTLCLASSTCDALLLPRPTTERERRLVHHRRSKELVETPFAVGAVAVIVHAENPIESLTLEQVAAVFQTRTNRWSDLDVIITAKVEETVCVVCQSLAAKGQRAALVEGHSHAVERALNRIIPGEDTGAPGAVRQLTSAGDRFGSHITTVGDGFEVQRRVAKDPLAIGLVPWGTADLSGVKVVPIRRTADAQPVAPNEDSIRSRMYPLAHYLYWCTAGEPEGKAKALRAFALSPTAQAQLPATAGGLPIMGAKVE
jgi:phosphate transport system substrate-binding protein